MTEIGLAGVSWPWKVFPKFVYDNDVVTAAIVDIVFTALRERKMNTSHGSQIVKTVFENKGSLLRILAQRELSFVIKRHLPMVTVLNIDVSEGARDTDPVDIVVDYDFRGTRDVVIVPVTT